MYISTEDVFPSRRLQQLIPPFVMKHKHHLPSRWNASDNIFVEHAAHVVCGLMQHPGWFNSFTPELKTSPGLLKRNCISEVGRIWSIKIIFHLSKLWKAKFSLLWDAIFLVRLEEEFHIDHSDIFIPFPQYPSLSTFAAMIQFSVWK